MGMFQVKVKIANLIAPDRFFEEMFWVDTGALYSSVPEDRLDALDIPATGHKKFILADGREGQLRCGSVQLEIEGFPDRMACPVVFSPPGSPCLLGATALEILALDVDPGAGVLKPKPMLLLGVVAC